MKKHIPNFLTLGNLFFGCLSLVNIYNDSMLWAAIFVGIAALFDVADGLVARLLKTGSPLGAQLDSLSDVVSFGVVPASMAFVMIKYNTETTAGTPYWTYIAFLIALASAYRLAKFNIDNEQHHYFKGMPTPANALFWAALSAHWAVTGFIWQPEQLLIFAVVLSFLLVCNMRMFSLKVTDWSLHAQWVLYLFIVFVTVAVAVFDFLGVALSVVCYPVFSWFYFFVNRSKYKARAGE
ncbi:MAG: CDP-diacylglycerol--serine O-phosphatidyltransferase [Bacteroidales bacterium]|jgi:CDP-diacylglycerol--serine O-phosphatidyltransferase|nr:CDP-diacylglycerol--serine O-phosphatidyltransferase [Bacteroidales bacterium]